MNKQTKMGWVYAEQGDYHRNLDPNWSYTPTYLQKRKAVRRFMQGVHRQKLTLDLGCGEGVVVEEFLADGYNIRGVDANYESEHVMHGDVLALPFGDEAVGAVLFLDVFEHIHFADQPRALAEIFRVLEPGGVMMMTIPNLAHLNSRVRLALRGDLDRTDCELNHVGERPLAESLRLIRAGGFSIEKVSGMTFSMPYVYRGLICQHARRLRWLHDAMEPLAAFLPSLAMINVVICRKPRQ